MVGIELFYRNQSHMVGNRSVCRNHACIVFNNSFYGNQSYIKMYGFVMGLLTGTSHEWLVNQPYIVGDWSKHVYLCMVGDISDYFIMKQPYMVKICEMIVSFQWSHVSGGATISWLCLLECLV
jgi:hypothetical protein